MLCEMVYMWRNTVIIKVTEQFDRFHLFSQVTLGLSEGLDETRPEDIDLLILRNVRKTAGRSKHLMGELKGLKAKVYGFGK